MKTVTPRHKWIGYLIVGAVVAFNLFGVLCFVFNP
jgi:hypothetical protein